MCDYEMTRYWSCILSSHFPLRFSRTCYFSVGKWNNKNDTGDTVNDIIIVTIIMSKLYGGIM